MSDIKPPLTSHIDRYGRVESVVDSDDRHPRAAEVVDGFNALAARVEELEAEVEAAVDLLDNIFASGALDDPLASWAENVAERLRAFAERRER